MSELKGCGKCGQRHFQFNIAAPTQSDLKKQKT